MNNNRLLEVESALVHLNMLRDKEYAFAWCRDCIESHIFLWPATGNHTVWSDIANFAHAIDEYAYPGYENVNGKERVVYKIGII